MEYSWQSLGYTRSANINGHCRWDLAHPSCVNAMSWNKLFQYLHNYIDLSLWFFLHHCGDGDDDDDDDDDPALMPLHKHGASQHTHHRQPLTPPVWVVPHAPVCKGLRLGTPKSGLIRRSGDLQRSTVSSVSRIQTQLFEDFAQSRSRTFELSEGKFVCCYQKWQHNTGTYCLPIEVARKLIVVSSKEVSQNGSKWIIPLLSKVRFVFQAQDESRMLFVSSTNPVEPGSHKFQVMP